MKVISVRTSYVKCALEVIKKSWVIPGLKLIKLFSCSTQMSMKVILLINVKMPTVVGILTFMSGMNTASEGFKSRKISIFLAF